MPNNTSLNLKLQYLSQLEVTIPYNTSLNSKLQYRSLFNL